MDTSHEKRWSHAVGQTLRAERGIANLTQAETARRTSITRTSYRLYELGERSPNITQLATIAYAFGIPFSKLVGEVERRAKEGQ